MKFVLNRNRVISGTSGHAIEFKKGELTHVPPVLYADVIAAGGIPETELAEDDLPKPSTTPETLAEREAAMFEVFTEIVTRGRRDDFTAGGAPHNTLMTAALGWSVQAKERDAAWAKFQLGKD